MREAMRIAGYDELRREQAEKRESGELMGIGVSFFTEVVGAGPKKHMDVLGQGMADGADLRVHADGRAVLSISCQTQGQAHETTFAQIVAEELGISPDEIQVRHGDTDRTPFGLGTYGSRSTPVSGAAAAVAARRVRDKARLIAAGMLETSPDDLVWEKGRWYVKGDPEKGATINEVAEAAYGDAPLPEGLEGGLDGQSVYDPPNLTYPCGAYICVVDIDPDTAEVKVRRFIAVDDCGVRINPMIVDGQIMGGLAEGVGIALMEVITFDDQGNCLNGSMMDYLIPTALECPDWELGATVTPCPHHPIGAKGVGESATNGSPPAIVNAVCDALYQSPRRRPRRHAAEPGAGLGRDAGQGRAAPIGGVMELDRIDLPGLATALGQRLRAAGVPVTPERSARFARALALVAPQRRSDLYWTARPVFVSSQAQLPTFDRVFAAVFDPALEPDEERGDPYTPTLSGSQSSERPPDPRARSVPGERENERSGGMRGTSSEPSSDEEEEREIEVPLAMASEEERLGKKRFEELEPDELERIRRMMSELELAAPRRLSRRRRRARRGEQLDLRRTLRDSLRTGGDPMTLARRRRRTRPRRLVLICDISGSMEPYARAYLHLMTSAVASGAPAEAFVFATRLTRLTRALGGRNPELAIQRAAEAAPDWSSGTRIGEALRTFNDNYGRRGMARGAVVVILSDGWERADPAWSGARWSGWRGSPTASSGSTPAPAPPGSPLPPVAWRRHCRTATHWSAATVSTPSTRSPRRWPEAIPPPNG